MKDFQKEAWTYFKNFRNFASTGQKLTYQCYVEIITHLANEGYTCQVSLHELRKAIVLLRGGDPRTVKTWIENLLLLGFVNKVNRNV